MASTQIRYAALIAIFLLSGCVASDQALFPSQTLAAASGQPTALSGADAAMKSFPGEPTGTFVGQKVMSLRNDLQQLQSSLANQNDQLQMLRDQTVKDSQAYHGTVAAIEARLQLGTTPGNPVLTQQWNAAEGSLDNINEDVLKMTRLSADVASTSSLAAYLLDSVRSARTLSGAVDEDHRQLRALEDETNGTMVLIERLLTELATDSQRQQQYLANARNNLATLAVAIKNGQYYGSSLAGGKATGGTTPSAGAGASPPVDRPLVVIRFDRPHVAYEDALYTAVKGALDRRPNAVFDVMAVTPSSGSPGTAALSENSARRNAQAVIRSLSQMGLPSERVRLTNASSPDASNGEVRVFVR
jgi:hypothetical protein